MGRIRKKKLPKSVSWFRLPEYVSQLFEAETDNTAQKLIGLNTEGDFVIINKNEIGDVTDLTGWATYVDTQYTDVSPFLLSANTKVTLPNNGLSKIETQMPTNVTKMYDPVSQTILGNTGDGLNITCEFFAIPTSASTTTIETSIDIGGTIGEIYPRLFTFPKGQGIVRPISFSITGYTLDTWEANGGSLKIISNGTCDIYAIRYVLTRTHKAV